MRAALPVVLTTACVWWLAPVRATQEPIRSSRVDNQVFTSAVFRNTRSLRVYVPAGYDQEPTRRYPVLYMNDGQSVFASRGWNLPDALDALIAAHRVPPMIVVGIDNAATIPGASSGAADRANEFLPYPDTLEPDAPDPQGLRYPDFLADEVLPFVATRYRVDPSPGSTGIGGSSYGGVAAVVAVVRRPGRFGRLLLESTPLFLFDERLTAEARQLSAWPEAVYVGIGTRETTDMAILTRGEAALDAFVALARSTAARVLFNVVADATHTAQAWRARLPTALEFLYGQSPQP